MQRRYNVLYRNSKVPINRGKILAYTCVQEDFNELEKTVLFTYIRFPYKDRGISRCFARERGNSDESVKFSLKLRTKRLATAR